VPSAASCGSGSCSWLAVESTGSPGVQRVVIWSSRAGGKTCCAGSGFSGRPWDSIASVVALDVRGTVCHVGPNDKTSTWWSASPDRQKEQAVSVRAAAGTLSADRGPRQRHPTATFTETRYHSSSCNYVHLISLPSSIHSSSYHLYQLSHAMKRNAFLIVSPSLINP
jgi:hypothetical protein